ncbi:MAG: SWIM zinc finger family protein [Thermoprotei archaeon]|nr:SWIM zinc finger family protein [Thermoprotei archaeon]
MRERPGDIEVDIAENVARQDKKRILPIALSLRFIKLSDKHKLWIYIGHKGDYVVIERLYCSCSSFIRSLTRKPGCPHLAALEEAKRLGKYRKLEANPRDIEQILWESLNTKLSTTLRKLLKTTPTASQEDKHRKQ